MLACAENSQIRMLDAPASFSHPTPVGAAGAATAAVGAAGCSPGAAAAAGLAACQTSRVPYSARKAC